LRADTRIQTVTPPDANASVGFSASSGVRLAGSLAGLTQTAIGTQYGLDALNLAPAYQYQDGWALGSVLDTGIDTTHPEFQAFGGINATTQADSGSYLGVANAGNLMRLLSGDEAIQSGSSIAPASFGRNIDERRCVLDTVDASCINFCRNAANTALDPAKCQDMDASCKADFGGHGIQLTVFGHGTHTSGLFGAKWTDRTGTSDKVLGTCPNCALSQRKIVKPFCIDAGPGFRIVRASSETLSAAGGVWSSMNAGASVISMSFGTDKKGSAATFDAAAARGILMVSATGNDKIVWQYPAARADVVPATGFMPKWPTGYQSASCTLGADCANNCIAAECLWLNPKNYFVNNGDCTDASLQCGSGTPLSTPLAIRKPELTTAATRVMSTFYRTFNPSYPACWTRTSQNNCAVDTCASPTECFALCGNSVSCPSSCSENNDGISDGYGLCTGTSMSTPQLAGLFGLILSTNPLLNVETAPPVITDLAIDGVRDLLSTTARTKDAANISFVSPRYSWYISGQTGNAPFDSTWGAGIPQADRAMQRTMGKIFSATAKHRLTPLFVAQQMPESGYAAPNEFAYGTAPPLMSSYLNPANGMANYSSVGDAVRGYSAFRIGTFAGSLPAGQDITPRAEVFVLANDYRNGSTPIIAAGTAPALPPLPAGVNASEWRVEALYALVKCRTQRISGDDASKAAAEQCVTPPNGGGTISTTILSYANKRSPGFESTLGLERELDAFRAAGYELRGKVGFVIVCISNNSSTTVPPPCTPMPELASPNTTYTKVVRACKGSFTSLSTFDCAFTRGSAVGAGIYSSYSIATQPSGVSAMPQTYAWANTHADADDLINGQELLLGTNQTQIDSDADSFSDSNEWPVAAIQPTQNCYAAQVCVPADPCPTVLLWQNVVADPLSQCGNSN
jgi:serine protease